MNGFRLTPTCVYTEWGCLQGKFEEGILIEEAGPKYGRATKNWVIPSDKSLCSVQCFYVFPWIVKETYLTFSLKCL